jgi:uncharacterized phage protein gp47/JayE
MALSISQLKTPPTRSEIVAWMLEVLRQFGFQTTGWQEGRIQHTMLNAFATVASAFAQLSADIVNNVYNDTASGAGLTLYSRNRFDNAREGAQRAAGPFLLTNGGTVAHVLTVGQLIVEATESGLQYENTSAGTVPAGDTLNVDFRASLAGASGSIPNNSALTLITPLAGVTVTNPGPGDVDLDGFADPWYTIQTGTDPETDIELRQRNATKWGLLSVEKTATAYENLALAQQGVSKAKIIHNNPRGAGTVDVYVASGKDLTSTGDKALAQAAFAGYTFGTEEAWPPTNTPEQSTAEIKDPATLELNLVGVIYYDPQYTLAEVQDAVEQSLDDFVTLMPIGGKEYISGAGRVTVGDILEAIENTVGVRSVTLTEIDGSGTIGDIELGATTLLQAPADWITGRLNFSAVTS